MEIKDKALFIGGCPKSGTTLFLSLLEGHSRLVVFPEEVHFFDDFCRRTQAKGFYYKLDYVLKQTQAGYLAGTKQPDLSREGAKETVFYDHLDGAKFKRLCRTHASIARSDEEILMALIRSYAETTGQSLEACQRWVEKTPANVRHSDRLFEMFPRAKLIHVVRDPRAVFASRRARAGSCLKGYGKAFRYLEEWNKSIWHHRGMESRKDAYLVVRYEDLIYYPQEILERVFAFIGIEPEAANYEPTKGGVAWAGNSTFTDGFQGISRESANAWKTELSEDELWWVEYHCHQGMNFFGYVPRVYASEGRRPRFFRRLRGESLLGYVKSRFYSFLADCNAQNLRRLMKVLVCLFSFCSMLAESPLWLTLTET